tara:strand:- start:521 stop:898 length:378 start_codon:yes stop_codon:yes gene_type:complete
MNLETIIAAMFTGVGFGVIVFLLFVWAISRRIQFRVDSEISGIVEKLAQDRLIALTVEIDNNQYFCYNALTKDFVCQGYSLKEIIERFRLRYPDKAAAIYDGDETAVKTLKSQMDQLDKSDTVQS